MDEQDQQEIDGCDRSAHWDCHLLEKALSNQEEDIRIGACSALGRIGDARGIPLLATGLTDADEPVRIAAAEALGRWVAQQHQDCLCVH